MTDRKEYLKKYYQSHKEQYRHNYNAQTQYLRYVDVKKAINKLKKEIGNANLALVWNELDKLERFKGLGNLEKGEKPNC